MVGEPLGAGQSTRSVPALLAVVTRLEESVAALQSRAAWFEKRLDERERELRSIAADHDRQLRLEQAKQEASLARLRQMLSEQELRKEWEAGRIASPWEVIGEN